MRIGFIEIWNISLNRTTLEYEMELTELDEDLDYEWITFSRLARACDYNSTTAVNKSKHVKDTCSLTCTSLHTLIPQQHGLQEIQLLDLFFFVFMFPAATSSCCFQVGWNNSLP